MSFNHPYQPYDIQLQLMKCIYDTLDDGKRIAILESPTGTGKTLSLLCSTISWLRDNKSNLLSESSGSRNDNIASSDVSDSEDEPDWVKESYKSSVLSDKLLSLNDYEKHLDTLQTKNTVEEIKTKKLQVFSKDYIRGKKKRKIDHVDVGLEEADYLPKDYYSDSEDMETSKTETLSNEVKLLLAKLEARDNGVSTGNSALLEKCNPVKIFFASRTHSQLNQFASQLKLPKFKSSFDEKLVPNERIKYIPLGSRKQLCINSEIRDKWKTLEAINDACKELVNSEKGCPYHNNRTSNTLFRDHAFANVHDIEDILDIGEALHICPYYATRESVKDSEIVTLPYQYILSKSTRDNLGINLKNSIVVIDEAHNLIDTINSIHSAQISLQELQTCHKGLQIYLQKFKYKLNAGNRVNILKLLKLFDILIEFIKKSYKKSGQKINFDELLTNSNADTVNIHKLNKFINTSKIAYKIDTYLQALMKPENKVVKKPSTPLLYKIASFLACLTNPKTEGQFFFEKNYTVKYMLLDPSKTFQTILDECRCVILAGGTMEPVSDFFYNLFPTIPREQSITFSCDHVIPDENLNTYIVQEPIYEFTFEKRQVPSLVNGSLFQFFIKLSQSIPKEGGVVAFFPSYQYLQFVIDSWKNANLFDKLNKLKQIFFELKDSSDPLPEYTENISNGKPSVLFAVVGGKLSEGINFQDNLCRAVVIVGLPFPNVFSGELQIKKEYLESKIYLKGGSKKDANAATKDFYETICMKAVNQSIGRAIRHVNDYANIYLLDKRYATPHIQGKLSLWVRKRIQLQSSTDSIMTMTKKYFDDKRMN